MIITKCDGHGRTIYVCLYPSSAHRSDRDETWQGHSFEPWECHGVGSEARGNEVTENASAKREAQRSEATENASAKREARGSEATTGVGKVALTARCATREACNESKG